MIAMTSGKSIRIAARAPDQAGNPAQISVDEKSAIRDGQATDVNLCVISEVSGIVLDSVGFPLLSQPGHEVLLAAYVEAILPGRIVAVTCAGILPAMLMDRTRRALATLGSQRIWTREQVNSWAMIGAKGLAPGIAREAWTATVTAVTAEAPLLIQDANGLVIDAVIDPEGSSLAAFQVEGFRFHQMSRGEQDLIAFAWIDQAGPPVFSLYHPTDPADSALIVQKIAEAPFGRTIGVIAPNGGAAKLSDAAKAALSGLGSKLIRDVTAQEGWCFIGTKTYLGDAATELKAERSVPMTVRGWAFPQRDDQGRSGLSVQSAARDFGNYCRIAINTAEAFPIADHNLGVTIRVVAEDTGLLDDGAVFDLRADPTASDRLAAFVESLPTGRLALVGIMDDGGDKLNDRARHALASLGSGLSFEIGARHSYALVGRKGSAPGSVPELLGRSGPVATLGLFPLHDHARPFMRVEVAANGRSNSIIIDGQPVMPRFNGYGVRAALIDVNGQVLQSYSHDDLLRTADLDELAALVEQVGDDTIIALAALGSRKFARSERFAAAMRACGSNLPEAETWAIVGRRGYDAGGVAEAGFTTGLAAVASDVPRKATRPSGLNVDLFCATHDFGNSVRMAVNGSPIETSSGYGRGMRLAVINESSGAVELADSFDTYDSAAEAKRLAEVLNALPPGRIVLMAVRDNAVGNLTEEARRAIRACGSVKIGALADRGSWCLAGYKGAAAGSAAECLNNAGPAALETWLPPKGQNDLLALALVTVIVMGIVLIFAVLIYFAFFRPKDNYKTPPKTRKGLFISFCFDSVEERLKHLRLGPQPLIRTHALGQLVHTRGKLDSVTFLTDKTPGSFSKDIMLNAIEDLFAGAKAGDTRVIYYYGHGWSEKREAGRVYSLNVPIPGSTYEQVHGVEIKDIINRRAKGVKVVLVTHACMVGGMLAGPGISGVPWVHLSSSVATETSIRPFLSDWTEDFTLMIHHYVEEGYDDIVWPSYERMYDYLYDSIIYTIEPDLTADGGFDSFCRVLTAEKW